MAPREAFAFVRAPLVRLTSSLRRASLPSLPSLATLPTLRRPGRRAIAVMAAVAAAFPAAYVIARETPLFAVRAVEVRGSPAVAADVADVLDAEVGSSLVAVDADGLAERLREIPSVRSASVDRAFPHTLVVVLEAERPLAVVPAGARAWLVAESGRVVEAVEPEARPRLPRIRVPLPRPPEPGETLGDAATTVALRVLRLLPRGLSRDVLFAGVESGRASLVLRDGVEVRLGEPVAVETKVAAAGAVLRALTAEERGLIGYVDATVPERVVTGTDAVPSSESS
jgi:cell division protein FtsQ